MVGFVRKQFPVYPLWIAMSMVGLSILLTTSTSSADMIIKRPGAHPDYSVEAEPHLLLRPYGTPGGDVGWGLGGRFTIPLVKNGFVSSINNNVGIGFGLDWMQYDNCYYDGIGRYCDGFNRFVIPVVMQWNFFLSDKWSVFGEPGVSLNFYGNCNNYYDRNGRRYGSDYGCNTLDLALFVGGRYHFSDKVTLTMRLGWPYLSIGVSFLL
jgi:hypothetical protein